MHLSNSHFSLHWHCLSNQLTCESTTLPQWFYFERHKPPLIVSHDLCTYRESGNVRLLKESPEGDDTVVRVHVEEARVRGISPCDGVPQHILCRPGCKMDGVGKVGGGRERERSWKKRKKKNGLGS